MGTQIFLARSDRRKSPYQSDIFLFCPSNKPNKLRLSTQQPQNRLFPKTALQSVANDTKTAFAELALLLLNHAHDITAAYLPNYNSKPALPSAATFQEADKRC